MKKNIDSATYEQNNADKGITDTLDLGTTNIIRRNPDTNRPYYEEKLTSFRERALFVNLCNLVTYYRFNSFDYTSLNDIGAKIGESHRGHLSKFINKLIDLELIKKETDQNHTRIYINPSYFTKSMEISHYVTTMFNCKTTEKKKKPKKLNSVTREKENPEDILKDKGF